jgi:hypothetical protein
MRLHELLGLSASQDPSAHALQSAIRGLTRRDATAVLDVAHARAQTLRAPSAHASYWTSVLQALRAIMQEQHFSAAQIKAADAVLHALCERAGELLRFNAEDFDVMGEGLSAQGAERILQRLETHATDLDFVGLNGQQKATLQKIAARSSATDQPYDSMKPQIAWDILAERLGYRRFVGQFGNYYAGEALARAAWEVKHPDLRALVRTAGLIPYRLPRQSFLRETLLLATPLLLGERLGLIGAPQSRETILQALKLLSEQQSLALLRDLTPHAVARIENRPNFHFGSALLHHLRKDGIRFSDDLADVWYERNHPTTSEAFQRRALRVLFHNAGVPKLHRLDAQAVTAKVSAISRSLARIADTLFTDEMAPSVGKIFQTPYVDELMRAFSDAAYTVPSLYEQALQNIDRAHAWAALTERVGLRGVDRLNQREVAIEVLTRDSDAALLSLARAAQLDATLQRKDVITEANLRRAWRELVELLALPDLADAFHDEPSRVRVARAASALGDSSRIKVLVANAGLAKSSRAHSRSLAI